MFVCLSTPCMSQDVEPPRPPAVATKQELLRKYVWSTLGVSGVVSATLGSTFEQWRNAPNDWGRGGTGYAKRWASNYAESAVGDTTKFAVARLFHQDPSFTRCECVQFGSRVRHAVTAPFTARTRDGRRVWSLAIVAGLLAAQVVPASTWYPGPHGVRDGVAGVGVDIGAKIGVDVLKEFILKRPRSAAAEHE